MRGDERPRWAPIVQIGDFASLGDAGSKGKGISADKSYGVYGTIQRRDSFEASFVVLRRLYGCRSRRRRTRDS